MTKKKNKKIPKFKNYKEEAKFWDTHDTTDFEEEFKPVKVKFSRNLNKGITVRLDTTTLNKLRSKAHDKGIGPTTLARMWIIERLRKEESNQDTKTK